MEKPSVEKQIAPSINQKNANEPIKLLGQDYEDALKEEVKMWSQTRVDFLAMLFLGILNMKLKTRKMELLA